MRFERLNISGAYLLTPERRPDDRGHFARIFCERELAEHDLPGGISQINSGFSHRAGTLRGMHFQLPPHSEVKVVRCVRGALYDVIVDLRPTSPTFKGWLGVTLDAESGQM